ncbi:MAG TPA: ribonuclease P protein component [bacterium]
MNQEKVRYTFPVKLRIKKGSEFKKVMMTGGKNMFDHFVVFGMENGLAHPRLGITVTKAVGNAPVRNRVKRLLREFFRLHQYELKSKDFVVIARKGCDKLVYKDVAAELTPLTKG